MSMDLPKTLVLIRHGHRDTSRRELDNGLSDKGKDQARWLKRFFSDRFGELTSPEGIWLVSSPKKRCQETLQPIAKALGRDLDIHPELDEQNPREPFMQLQGRVQDFIKEWRASQAQVTLVASHGDWLPIAAETLLGQSFDFKKGCWFEVQLEPLDGTIRLRWYVPSFKPIYK